MAGVTSPRIVGGGALTAPGGRPAEASPPVVRRTRHRGWAGLLLAIRVVAVALAVAVSLVFLALAAAAAMGAPHG